MTTTVTKTVVTKSADSETLTIKLTFSDTLHFIPSSGTAVLHLNNGHDAVLTSSLPSNTLTFTYTPGAGVTSGDLIVSALNTDGAILVDSGGSTPTVSGVDFHAVVTAGLFSIDDGIPPHVTDHLVHDTGTSATDRITSDLTLTGTGDANATVHFTVDGTPIDQTATANNAGVWTFTPTGLGHGAHTIVATETDVFGETGTATLSVTLDNVGPELSHVTVNGSALTKAATLTYDVQFTEKVTGVTASDFTVSNTAGSITGAKVTGVTAVGTGGDHYTVTVATGKGDGDLQLNFNGGPVHDVAGNTLPDGTFADQVTYNTESSPKFVAVGDLNGDGKADLAVANNDDDSVSVLFGNGDGTFQDQQVFSAGIVPENVVIGDFNGDGKADLIVGDAGSGGVAVLTGNGHGVFAAAAFPGTGGTTAAFLAAGDLNGDGKLDLVTVGGGNVSVLINTSSPTTISLAAPVTTSAGNGTYFVALADINGDGKLDIVTTNYGSNTLSLFAGNGDGTFQSATTVNTGAGPMFVAVADVNHDGIADLITANWISGGVSVLIGTGGGAFATAVTYSSGLDESSVAVVDVDGDGNLDLVVTDYSGSVVNVFAGSGTGTFAPLASYGVGGGPTTIATGDFNGDGRPDIVAGNEFDGNVSVLLNNAPPSFDSGTTTIDKTAPAVTVHLSNDAGPSAIDKISYDPSLSGTGDALTTVTLKEGATVVATTNSDVNGIWSVDAATLGLSAGKHTITATETDQAGNTGTATVAFTVDTTAPTVTKVTSSPASGGVTTGVPVTITLTGSEKLYVSATAPTLVLDNGGIADYVSGSGTTALVFKYTPTGTDSSGDLHLTAVNPGTGISDLAGNDVILTGTSGLDLHVGVVETPVASSVTIPSDPTAKTGETVRIDLNLNEAVTSTGSGDPTLTLSNGAIAHYDAADSTSTKLEFTYTVGAADKNGDLHITALKIPTTLTIADGGGHRLSTTVGIVNHDLGVTVDTVAPKVTLKLADDDGASATDNKTDDATLTGTGDPNATVHFTVDGNPIMDTVTANSAGLWTYAPTLSDGSHTISAYEDDAAGNRGNSTPLTFTYDTVDPTLSSITKIGSAADGFVHAGETLTVLFHFSEALTGASRVSFGLGDGGTIDTEERLTFDAVDSDLANGIIAYHGLITAGHNVSNVGINEETGFGLTDIAGNGVDPFAIIGRSLGVKIDTNAPIVKASGGVTSTTAANTHVPLGGVGGNPIEIDVNTNEAVVIHGATTGITLKLSDGGVATYDAGHSTSTKLSFDYTPAKGQNSGDLKTTGLALAGGTTITDAAGNKFNAAGAAGKELGIIIDTNAPAVSHVTVTGATAGAVHDGDDLTIALTLKDTTVGDHLHVTGSPTLTLSDGGTATYDAGMSDLATGLAVFDYTASSASSTDLKITGFSGGGNTITDDAGNTPTISAALADLHLIENVFTWAHAAGGQYNIDTNWTPGGPPGAGNTAKLTAAGANYTVTVDSNDDGLSSHSIGTLVLAKNATLAITEQGTSDVTFSSTDGTTNAGNISVFINTGVGDNAAVAFGTDGHDSTVANSGGISVRGDHASMEIIGDVTLNGLGKINLYEGATIATDGTHAATLDNIDNTITFFGGGNTGSIGDDTDLTFINEAKGVVYAQDPASQFNIQADGGLTNYGILKSASQGGLDIISSGTVTNHNLIEVVGTGVVSLEVGALDNTGGTLFASATGKNNAFIEIDGASATSITGGTFKTTGADAAILVTDADTTIDGVTNTGALRVGGASHDVKLTVTGGTFTNAKTGVITLVSDVHGAELNVLNDLTLGGGGQIDLTGAGADIGAGVVGTVLTNMDNTIHGAGTVGDADLSLVNQLKGLIVGDGTDVLHLDAASVTNAGILKGINANGLDIHTDVANQNLIEALGASAKVTVTHGTITNTAGKGVILASGTNAEVDLGSDPITVVGGTLKTAGATAHIDVVGGSTVTFDGSQSGNPFTNSGALHVVGGIADFEGTVNNSGAITVNDSQFALFGQSGVTTFNNTGTLSLNGDAMSSTVLGIYSDLTLTGAGHINLSDDTQNEITAFAVGTLDNVNNIISGSGVFTGADLTVHNEKLGVIDAKYLDNALSFSFPAGVTNEGTIEAHGSLFIFEATVNDDASTAIIKTVAANAVIELNDGHIAGIGTISTVAHSTIESETTASSITATKIVNAGTIAADTADLTVTGAVTNTGNLDASGGHLTFASAVTGGAATIDFNGTLEFDAASNAKVTFTTDNGVLVLANATNTTDKFIGTIAEANSTSGHEIQLGAIDYTSGDSQVGFVENAAHTSGVLTATDGVHTLALTFLGNHTIADFTATENATTHHLDLMLA